MSGLNFSDNIEARGRKLHLQTSLGEDERIIVSSLFDSGRLVIKEEIALQGCADNQDISDCVEKLHIDRVNEIELLYDVSLKVKTVRHARSLCALGAQFLRWNLLDEAISELELSIQYSSDNGEAYKHLGKTYQKRGGFEEAIEVLRKGVKAFPEYPDLWLELGISYLKSNELINALKAFRKALKINPSYDEVYFFISRTLAQMVIQENSKDRLPDKEKCMNLARENFTRGTAISNRFRNRKAEQVMRLFHQNKWQDSINLMDEMYKELQPVIDLGFDRAFYLNLMYGEMGRDFTSVKEYVEKMESLVNKYSKFPDLHNKLGIAYLIECRNLFNNALHHFKIACDLNPDYDESKRNLKLAKNDGKGLLLLLRAMLK